MAASTIEEALHDIIIADNTVKAITTRCYPGTLPQGAVYPLVLYMKITGNRDHALRGATGWAHPRFQVETWATTYAGAKALASAVRNALDDYKGTQGSVVIGSILIDSERDVYEDVVLCHRVIMDFMIWHKE